MESRRETESAGMGESEREKWQAEMGGQEGRKEEKIEGWDKKRKKMRWRAASRRKCRCVKCPSKPLVLLFLKSRVQSGGREVQVRQKSKRLTITMMGGDAIWLQYFGALC